MASPSRRRPRDDDSTDDGELEEGEYVPGSLSTAVEDYCYHAVTPGFRFLQPPQHEEADVDRHHHSRHRFSRLEDIIAVGPHGALPSPTPSDESDGTISDDDGDRSASSIVLGGGAGAASERNFTCSICGKGFPSGKAVDGHMRVHRRVAVSGGWAATGMRGWAGGRPAAAAISPTAAAAAAELMEHSSVVPFDASSNLSSTPVASAGTDLSRSRQSRESSSGSVAEPVVVAPANPSTGSGTLVHQPVAPPPPPAPTQQQLVHLTALAPPAVEQAPQLLQHPAVPPPPAGQQGLPDGQPAGQPRQEYTCKLCGKSYPTHQGLGGHAAGHKNKQKEAEAAAAAAAMAQGDGAAFLAALRRGGRRAEEPHACQKCPKVFATGVALGGHMRMHYTGPPIVHRKKRRCLAPPVMLVVAGPPAPAPAAAVTEADLALALSTAKTEEPSSSSSAPAVPGRVRLFGIDISPPPQVQAPSNQQPPSESDQQAPSEQGSGSMEDSSSPTGEQEQQ